LSGLELSVLIVQIVLTDKKRQPIMVATKGIRMSSFDEDKNYYVFKYVVDSDGEPTEYAGEIQAFVVASDPWDAVSKAGYDDMNIYGANYVDNIEGFETAIADERKILKKISKQLKDMREVEETARKKILEDRECPNGCGKMDENFSCDKCGFGHEREQLIKDIDKQIKDDKKAGTDTTRLEAIRDSLQASLDSEKCSGDCGDDCDCDKDDA
jgi:hypothetical protein